MIYELYNLFLFALGSMLIVFGLCFLMEHIPSDHLRQNYRKARLAMAICYFIFAAVNFIEYIFDNENSNILLKQSIVLSVAFSQAFLVTLACLLLLDKEISRRWFIRELLVVVVFMIAILISYFILPTSVFHVALYFFMMVYIAVLAHYTLHFIQYYRHFHHQMDNYFSEREADALRWIAFSFFAALSIGVIALVSTYFMSVAVGLVFEIISLLFYTYFGIRIINYVWKFGDIKYAMLQTETNKEDETIIGEEILIRSSIAALEGQIGQWVADKHFIKQGVTIKDLAVHLGTNTKYISVYINNNEGKTFRNWIGALRIEEAQRLMKENPGFNLETIAECVGYASKSTFLSQFTKQMNMAPSEWRNIQ